MLADTKASPDFINGQHCNIFRSSWHGSVSRVHGKLSENGRDEILTILMEGVLVLKNMQSQRISEVVRLPKSSRYKRIIGLRIRREEMHALRRKINESQKY